MNRPSSKATARSVIHTHADNVLSSLSTGSDGIFQRDFIMALEGESKSRIVLWTFKLEKAGKVVEWLFRMTVEKDEEWGCALNLNSVKHDELPMVALEKLASLRAQRTSWKVDVVKGVMQDCLLILRNMKYGQTSFFLTGSFCSISGDSKEIKRNYSEKGIRLRLTERLTDRITDFRLHPSLKLTGLSDEQAVLDSIEGIKCSIFGQFEDSERVDEDRLRDTIEEIGKEEAGQLTDPKERAFMEDAKKMLAMEKSWKCVSHEGNAPIRISKLREDGDSVPWCKAEAVIHTSAKRLLAYLLNFDSVERTMDHKDKHGDLPRRMHVGGQCGINDARHFFYCIRLPNALRTRRFEVRAVWEKDKNDEHDKNKNDDCRGGAVYRFAWCPADEVNKEDNNIDRIKAECGFDDGTVTGKSFLENCVLARTRGIYELREVTENVAELTLVRHDKVGGNTHSMFKEINLIKEIKGIFSDLQKKYERNERVVDTEVRLALADTMRKSGRELKLTADQEEIFRRLHDLKADGMGWSKLESPTPDVKMWIKYHQRKRKGLATGKAEGILDCTAEEAAAWFFDYCGHEKMRIHAEEGHGVHLEIRGENDSRRTTKNERTFAMVKEYPFPLTKREFVFKHIWKVKKHGVSVGVWPAGNIADYGRFVGKTVKGTLMGLFVARNIGRFRGINQCKVTYYRVS